MAAYLTIDDICSENTTLKNKIIQLEDKIKKLEKENVTVKEYNKELKNRMDDLIDENAVKILEYFHSVHSIRRTAWKFGMEMDELYELIPQWDDCSDGLKNADDYIECRIEVIGRREYDEEEEENMTKEELEFRLRPLDEEDITNIIADYKESTLSLYELADRYELQINYLFRILKEKNIIEKETDAKGYAGFYEEHMGSGCEWDGKSELGFIEEFIN
jgi:hypothetical protein